MSEGRSLDSPREEGSGRNIAIGAVFFGVQRGIERVAKSRSTQTRSVHNATRT